MDLRGLGDIAVVHARIVLKRDLSVCLVRVKNFPRAFGHGGMAGIINAGHVRR